MYHPETTLDWIITIVLYTVCTVILYDKIRSKEVQRIKEIEKDLEDMPYAKVLYLTHPDPLSDKEWNRLCKALHRANAKGFQFLNIGIASCRLKFLEDDYGYHVYADCEGGSTIKWNLLFKQKNGMRVIEEGSMLFSVFCDNQWRVTKFCDIKKGETFHSRTAFDGPYYEDDDGNTDFIAEENAVNRTILCYPKEQK